MMLLKIYDSCFVIRYIIMYIAKKSSEIMTAMENQVHYYPIMVVGSSTAWQATVPG